MQRKFYRLSLVFAVCIINSTVILAQKPVKTAAPATASHKGPKAKTWLGKVTGVISLNAEEARQLVNLPLKITDDKNIDYQVSSYQFAYKRIGVTEDEETGKTMAQSDMAANRFTTTPLPAVWQKNIIEGLHTGEELYFFDIIVFDKQGRRFFAPDLKITIQ